MAQSSPPSPSAAPARLDDDSVLALTRAGERELNEAGTLLSPVQLEALVLIDGQASVAQVLKRAKGSPADALRASLGELVGKGLVSALARSDSDAIDPGDFFQSTSAPADAGALGEQVGAEADANTEFLLRNGYCVNIARRPQEKPASIDGRKPTVLVIDDDPDICRLLQMYLKLEGFDTRTAGNREEILAAFRNPSLPDLVVLDVQLTDANGFDILAKMRQHPVLKKLPVIMLTAEATRAAVLRGLLGGADGYITKPFQIHPLVRAVNAVLGRQDKAKGQDWDYSL